MKNQVTRCYRMNILKDIDNGNIRKEMEVSLKSERLCVSSMTFFEVVNGPDYPEHGENLNMICVH